MLAKPVGDQIPQTSGLLYEPKWDGFRCIVHRTDDGVVLQSRKEEDFTYLFPEMEQACLGLPPGTTLDGELVVVTDGELDFDALGNRIRPRSEAGGWKIRELSEQHPTQFVAFDLLRSAGEDIMEQPFSQRRELLSQMSLPDGLHLTPVTDDPQEAARWFSAFEGAGLDGVICKAANSPYTPGKRTMLKVKHVRTADVVVAGWREYKHPADDGSPLVGALLLGLYDDAGVLHNVGSAGSFSRARREDMVAELASLECGPEDGHPWASGSEGQRVPGMPSRWTGKKDMSFHPLRPDLVAEVKYDQMQGDRFRHVASFLRWRPDRDPRTCTYAQLESAPQYDLAAVLRGEVG